MLAELFLFFLGAYLLAGFVLGVPFVLAGVNRIDAHALHGSWGFRFLILPGTIFLWPLLAWRWWRRDPNPPTENNAHRCAARRPKPL